jgi:XTP/dITP diphosphohydrolase
MFIGLPIDVLSLDDAGIQGEALEDGETLEANALKKARFAHEKSGKWAMADDTGIFIDSLGGRPGIYAARWAGESASTAEITQFTLNQLKDVPLEKRTATFRTVAAVISPDGSEHLFTGEVSGSILPAEKKQPQPKMPYSGIFQPDGFDTVWAEMTIEEENQISHRGQAFSKVRKFLQQIIQ